jgi:hypothetical protein
MMANIPPWLRLSWNDYYDIYFRSRGGKIWRGTSHAYIMANEQVFRILKHLLATEACQVHSEHAYYGHLVLRLMASFILYYTSRVILKGR